MASCSVTSWFRYFMLVLLVQRALSACSNCYTVSRATFYGMSDDSGNSVGSCGYGAYGRNLNGGNVAGSSKVYRDGTGCGACYQVKCTDEDLCTEDGVNVVVTDMGEGDRTDFILSRSAFSQLAQDQDSADQLTAMGTVTIQYRRISCQYPGKNIMFKIDESSNFPNYLAFLFYNQGGKRDILVVDICETKNLECKLRPENHGAVWDLASPPKGPLSIRFLVSNGTQEEWITSANDIPRNWQVGAVYDSGVQLQD
uniref:TSA: Wollemia nobilis Ref_Wollemi_Transcript_4133_1062 transcribed RNA sequence n=1 Tax=Wollemia nobilis TaxID=56998 RepID=A0A0C9RYE1_9CONI